jgi:hypothetical protein
MGYKVKKKIIYHAIRNVLNGAGLAPLFQLIVSVNVPPKDHTVCPPDESCLVPFT